VVILLDSNGTPFELQGSTLGVVDIVSCHRMMLRMRFNTACS
jgi:hypothetical protein